MKILLLGEYSRLHNSLKAGLQQLGHNVTLVATGDSFKNYPADLSFKPRLTQSTLFFKFIKKAVYKLTKINLEHTEAGIRFCFLLPRLKGYDAVQLINSNALQTHPSWSRFLLKRVFRQNKKIFLLVCGDETPVIDALLQNKLKYDILTPYRKHPQLEKNFTYSLKYTTPPYRKLYNFVSKNSQAVIASDIDYTIPLQMMGVAFTHIPNPVLTSEYTNTINTVKDKVVIFLGINRLNRIRKGVDYFEKALAQIEKKYKDKVVILTTENVPYTEYIAQYKKAHILLDMVYAYDQGYNALEAMAQGKVVFTGAETEFLKRYALAEDEVCINALPNVTYLVDKLSYLIENPQEIERIGQNAQAFVKREHDYVTVAKKYEEVYKF